MKECRDIVRELIAMMECGAFEIEGHENEIGFMDYIAYYYNFGQVLTYDGLDFKIDGVKIGVQLTQKEYKKLNKAFSQAIDHYFINVIDYDGLNEIQAFLQE